MIDLELLPKKPRKRTFREIERANLKYAPVRYRREKEFEKWNTPRALAGWSDGGMCPWQAYLPIKFRGIYYTIYIRERHDQLSVKVMWGWHTLTKGDKNGLYGFIGFNNLLDVDTLDPKKDDLFEVAEKIGKQYIYELRNILPARERP